MQNYISYTYGIALIYSTCSTVNKPMAKYIQGVKFYRTISLLMESMAVEENHIKACVNNIIEFSGQIEETYNNLIVKNHDIQWVIFVVLTEHT